MLYVRDSTIRAQTEVEREACECRQSVEYKDIAHVSYKGWGFALGE